MFPRRPDPCLAISGIGAVFVLVHAWHVSLMREVAVVLVVDGLPVLLALGIVYAGWHYRRSNVDRSGKLRVLGWHVAGIVLLLSISLLSIEVHALLHGETLRHTFIIHANMGIAGGVAGLLVGGYDVARREHVAELDRERRKLSEFASVTSHDLRNPLNVAQATVALARETGEPEQFDRTERALDRMGRLIDDLLELACAGATVDEPRPVHLAALAESSWDLLETREADLRVEADRVVSADEGRLRQLFENLFRNAIEHGGDAVAVTVGQADGGFYVEDDGPGIPADEFGRVFESGYSTAEDGNGFGLAIVERIAEAHGWDVAVGRGARGGARFEFTGVRFASD